MTATESLAIQPNVYYTLEEAAHLLRIPNEDMLELLESGIIQGVNVKENWRVLGAALLELTAYGQDHEKTLVADWYKVTSKSLQEVWDNDEDSVYDNL
jgi:hypothetical protein